MGLSTAQKEMSFEEVQDENIRYLNAARFGGEEGKKKAAHVTNQDIVMLSLKEAGFSMNIVDYMPLTTQDLDRDWDNLNTPTKYVPVEKPIKGSLVSVSDFMYASNDYFYDGNIARIQMQPLVSRTFKMALNQIQHNPLPIRSYIEGITNNDFLQMMDFRFIEMVNKVIAYTGAIIDSPNPYLMNGDIVDLKQAFFRKKLLLKTALCTESTYNDIARWDYRLVGDIATDNIKNGLIGPDGRYKSFGGINWVTTLNTEIIPDGVVYGFAPSVMMGKFYMYGSPETIIEFKHPILSQKSTLTMGGAILNPNSCIKLDFR